MSLFACWNCCREFDAPETVETKTFVSTNPRTYQQCPHCHSVRIYNKRDPYPDAITETNK